MSIVNTNTRRKQNKECKKQQQQEIEINDCCKLKIVGQLGLMRMSAAAGRRAEN